MSDEMVSVSKVRLEELEEAERALEALEAAGVSDWEGYDQVVKDLSGW